MRERTDGEMTGGADEGQQSAVLHVDPAPDVREALTDQIAESDLRASVTSFATGEAARKRLDSQEFDCIVTELDLADMAWETLADSIDDDTRLILYTGQDPTDIPRAVSDRVDSLVQKGNDERGRQLLVEKIRSAITDPTGGDGPAVDPEGLAASASDDLAVFMTDEDGGIQWANQPVDTILPQTDGLSGSDDLYGRLTALLADTPDTAKAVASLHGSDRSRQGLLTLQGGDDERHVFHESYPLPDDHRATRVELFQDLRREADREERLHLFQTLVMNARDGLYTLDADGVIDFCNPAMAEILGYERSELRGMHAAEVMAQDELEAGQREVQRLIDDPDLESTVYDMTFVTKEGDHREVSLHVALRPGPEDTYTGLVGVMRDITGRKEHQHELERFETIIEAVGDPVYATNRDGEFIYVNEALEERTGYEASTLLGRHASVIFDGDGEERIDALVDQLCQSGESTGMVEIEMMTAGKDRYPAEVHAALLPSEDGAYRGHAGIARDISARKRREEHLEEFTSIVAHDLRNPLSVGEGNLNLYRETGDEEHLDAVAEAFEDMQRLIDDLLELAKVGEVIGETERIDLDVAAREAWQHVQTAGATLRVEADAEIQADRQRLRQALENLFRNSVEHGGSEVTVTIGSTPDGCYVADDGPGIPSDRRDAVFEHGYSTADDGTGFGLAIVSKIVEAHGWRIDVTESAEGGARFDISGVRKD